MSSEKACDTVQLRETQRAFDRAAATYDGPAGNNVVIQRMRTRMWRSFVATFPEGSRLLDLGCGTGLDAVYLGTQGYAVLATDLSPNMVERTRSMVRASGLEQRVSVRLLGVQELDRLQGEQFDGVYSNLGVLNCAPDLQQTAQACAALLRPGGYAVTSVIGRISPWEIAYYVPHGAWRRALVRWSSSAVPVPLNGETVWTRYYTPREFYRPFARDFALTCYRALRLFSPPPYMLGVYTRLQPICAMGEWLDERMGGWPIVRNAGDHFVMIMRRRR